MGLSDSIDERMQTSAAAEKVAELFQLNEFDKKALEVTVKFPKMTQSEIAETLNVSLHYYRNRITRPAFQRALSEYTKDIFTSVGELQLLAVKRLKLLVNDPDKDIALAAIRIAMAPMTNQHTLNVRNNNEGKVFEVSIGPNGQINKEFKNTMELLDGVIDVSPTPEAE
jgi:hypothetical protein